MARRHTPQKRLRALPAWSLALLALANAGCGERPSATFDPIAGAYADYAGRYITVQGRRLHYVEKGAGEPLILLHGFGGWAFSFRKVVEPLSARYRVVAIDMLGFGLSDKPPDGDYSLTGEARFVQAVMDSLGIQKAVILGHSYGGGVAVALALAASQRARAVILVNSITLKYGRLTVADTFLRTLIGLPVIGRLALLVAAPRDADFERIVRQSYARPQLVDEATVAGFEYPYHLPHAKDALAAVARTAGAGVGSPSVYPARLKVPVLVMWGERDPWISVGRGYQLAARIPGALFVVVRNAGHLPLEEEPEQCVRIVTSYVGSLTARERQGRSP
jgi:pimeloyl-ACP methyl ester carboxylesterase